MLLDGGDDPVLGCPDPRQLVGVLVGDQPERAHDPPLWQHRHQAVIAIPLLSSSVTIPSVSFVSFSLSSVLLEDIPTTPSISCHSSFHSATYPFSPSSSDITKSSSPPAVVQSKGEGSRGRVYGRSPGG